MFSCFGGGGEEFSSSFLSFFLSLFLSRVLYPAGWLALLPAYLPTCHPYAFYLPSSMVG